MLRTVALLFAFLVTPLASAQPKVLRLPMRTDGPKSLDPVRGSTQYDNIANSQIVECLLQYKYLKRPMELKPLLLREMPAISEDGRTWRFKLRTDVRFADDPCFPGGKGRTITPADVFFSWKRQADDSLQPKGWWLIDDQIVGLNAFRDAQNLAARATNPADLAAYENAKSKATGELAAAFAHTSPGLFNYDAPVPGLRALPQGESVGPNEFEVELTRPVQQFAYKLAMFQTAVIPREAVEMYKQDFGRHPVGTGPFMLDEWEPGKSLTLNRNPNYHSEFYDADLPPDPAEAARDKSLGLDVPAGKPIPFVDRIEFTMFVQDEPMWLSFKAGKIGATEVPSDNFEEAFNKRTRKLRPDFKSRGVIAHSTLLLDFMFDGFNMEDPTVGGYTPEKRALRQALALAYDLEEISQSFYNGLNTVYDGCIPPGIDGHPNTPGHRSPNSLRGPDIDRAKALLIQAGYPGGKGPDGKPLTIQYYVSRGGNNLEQSEMRKRQLARIGVQLKTEHIDFSELIEKINNKSCPMFSFVWGSDYPDAENDLALFYGPNEAPGSNSFNYKNPEYDRRYLAVTTLPPGPERTKEYESLRDFLILEAPYIGSMARERFYLVQPWVKNYKPSEDFWTWLKYLDVDDRKR